MYKTQRGEQNNASKEEMENSGRGQQSLAPSSAHVHKSHHSNCDLGDFDKYLDDGEDTYMYAEKAEEERLRQALSRIRHSRRE